MIQGSPEWYAARVGRVTASRLGDVMAMTKKGPGQARHDYLIELVAERLTQQTTERFQTRYMRDGVEREARARQTYEFLTGQEVVQTGFLLHPTIADFGASPDGLVGDDGVTEFKCLTSANHVEMLMGEPIEPKFIWQVQGQMSVTNRKWTDIGFYSPLMPADLQLCIRRVERDNEAVSLIEENVKLFLREVDRAVKSLDTTILMEAAE